MNMYHQSELILIIVVVVYLASSKEAPQCEYNKDLYQRHLGTDKDADEIKTKECIEPGCFYIYNQAGLGWKWPKFASLENPISGCRYDIPYLIQRTHASSDSELHKIIKMLRACYIGKEESDTSNAPTFCQPEYNQTQTTTSLEAMKKDDTWIGDYMSQVGEKCLYKFKNGVFFVKSGKRQLVVCCSNSSSSDAAFKGKCQKTTEYISVTKNWRKDDNNGGD